MTQMVAEYEQGLKDGIEFERTRFWDAVNLFLEGALEEHLAVEDEGLDLATFINGLMNYLRVQREAPVPSTAEVVTMCQEAINRNERNDHE